MDAIIPIIRMQIAANEPYKKIRNIISQLSSMPRFHTVGIVCFFESLEFPESPAIGA